MYTNQSSKLSLRKYLEFPPEALLISCSDLVFPPSELRSLTYKLFRNTYKMKNLGNSIPKYEPDNYFNYQLEYLLNRQKIKNIIVLGHTQCHFLEEEFKKGDQLHNNHPPSLIDTMKQLDLYEKQIDHSSGLNVLVQENVLCQIKHLRTYPLISDAIENNQLHLQGWIYKIKANQWYFFDNEEGQFVSFSSSDDLMQPKLQNFKTM